MKYTSQNKYYCTCPTFGTSRVTFTTYDSQKITQGCSSKSVSDCSTYTYNNDMDQVKCNACTTSTNSPVTILSSEADSFGKFKDICFPTGLLPKNCKSYYANVAVSSISTSSTVECYVCNTDFDKVPLSFYENSLPGAGIIKSAGFCATKGRWIIEESTNICKEYNLPGKSSGRISDTYLKCKTCKDTISNPANGPPCYKGNDKAKIASPTVTCTDG